KVTLPEELIGYDNWYIYIYDILSYRLSYDNSKNERRYLRWLLRNQEVPYSFIDANKDKIDWHGNVLCKQQDYISEPIMEKYLLFIDWNYFPKGKIVLSMDWIERNTKTIISSEKSNFMKEQWITWLLIKLL